MPIYEYYCDKCDGKFDEVLPMARYDEPTTEPCPACGATECVHRGVPSRIMTGVDTTLTADKATGGAFGALMNKMKKGLPPSHHEDLDIAQSRKGGRLGAQ
tara:strand:+ start:1576 stop:1878 length:303 start_codon:yes stop_codon:yes gene_type:complete